MDPIGAVVAAAFVLGATTFAVFRKLTDGSFRADRRLQRQESNTQEPQAPSEWDILVRELPGIKTPTLVQFSGEYCSQCRRNRVIFDEACRERPELSVVEIKVEENPDLVRLFNVRRTPTVFLFTDPHGLPLRTEGVVTPRSLSEAINTVIGAP